MESFVTLPWSTNGAVMTKTRRICDWPAGGWEWRELVKVVQRLLVVEGNQSNHSLTPAPPRTQPNFKWGKMRSHLCHRFRGKREEFEKTKQSWQSWLFGVAAAIWESAVAGGQFGKHFQRLSKTFAPRLKTFLFQSPDFRLIKLVIVLLSDYSESPNFPHSLQHDSRNIFIKDLENYFHTDKKAVSDGCSTVVL